jgi:hypothetical protein
VFNKELNIGGVDGVGAGVGVDAFEMPCRPAREAARRIESRPMTGPEDVVGGIVDSRDTDDDSVRNGGTDEDEGLVIVLLVVVVRPCGRERLRCRLVFEYMARYEGGPN